MVLFRLLLAASIIGTAAIPTAAGIATDDPCPIISKRNGDCPRADGEIIGGGVQLEAETTVGGNGGGHDGGGPGSGGTGAGTPSGDAPVEHRAARDDITVTGPVTLSDLVNFRPAPGIDSMEPDGWMIVGLDTNFYATAPVQVQSGLLLDLPAQVRFTPVRYRWAYGDGATRSASIPGATWAAQGVNEFDPTLTSHVYTASGTYYIDLTIDFAAEYRWAGGPWTTIAGTLAVPANQLIASAGGAKTVLVEHECTLNPSGPGC